jgi:hypothetical protein
VSGIALASNGPVVHKAKPTELISALPAGHAVAAECLLDSVPGSPVGTGLGVSFYVFG